MFINYSLLVSNPFINAFTQSDYLGKLIFIALIAASIISWIIICYKCWFIYQAKKSSLQFYSLFQRHTRDPLGIVIDPPPKIIPINPFLHLYALLKKQTIDLLHKNRQQHNNQLHLSNQDIHLIESHLLSGMNTQLQQLESNLFILPLIVSLGPFLGLLGTVWGILDSFSELQGGAGINNQAILGGISLALATTVLGLIDAIPALIGYSYLKNSVRTFTTEMECFSHEMLTAVELHHRQP
jgi:biopolymer transport protein TolQ